MKKIEELKWGSTGLIPAVVQDATTGEVLTVAYVSLRGGRLEKANIGFDNRGGEYLHGRGFHRPTGVGPSRNRPY